MRTLFRFVLLTAFALSPAILLADLQKGLDAYSEGDYATALAVCQPIADEGIAGAQFCVGRMYGNGFGVAMDDELALKWLGLAAANGHAEAQFSLGVMHANGWGVPMNDVSAANYYRMAAEQGFVQAQKSLAFSYVHGAGVEQSRIEAYLWYELAARNGDASSKIKCKELAEKMSQDELLGAQQLVLEWFGGIDGETMHAGRIE